VNDLDVTLNSLRIAVPDKHEGGPVPLTIKYCADGEPNCWALADGSAVYLDKEWAEKAAYMKTDEYRANIRKRADASHLVKAEVVEGWTGWVTTSGDEDDYYSNVEELLERHGDRLACAGVSAGQISQQLPSWAFCTTEETFDFDIEDAIRNYLEGNHHADADDWIEDWNGLDEFWKTWSTKQNVTSYFIDYKHIVVIDRERYEVELATAKKYLESVA
jgi:hypothetical protein